MGIKYLDDNGPDGSVLGQDADALIGFWGATPAAQPAGTLIAALTAGETTAADVAAALVDLYDSFVAVGLTA